MPSACKAHYLATGHLARSSEYVLWGYGKTGSSLARALFEHGKRPRVIVEVHPGRLGQRILGARVIAPDRLLEFAKPGEGPPAIASVARAGPRTELRAALDALGFPRAPRLCVCRLSRGR